MSLTYYAPTKLYIGDDYDLSSIFSEFQFHKVLVLYGGGSILKLGLLDEVTNALKKNGATYYVHGGVTPNPKVEFVRELLEKNYDVDSIIAIGGGSVIDAAKSYSVSYMDDCDPWEFNSYKRNATRALPIGVILTISAAGSEMSNSCVISNLSINAKQGFNNDIVRPKFAIMNAKNTLTVSKYQTSCGIVDIMMHTLERYMSPVDDTLADNLALGLLKTVYKNGVKLMDNLEDLDARREIMLSSSFSHNGLTSLGRPMCFRCHQFEHVMSALHDDISHGAGLAVVWPAYMKFMMRNDLAKKKFQTLGYEIFHIEKTSDIDKDVIKCIQAFEEFFTFLGMPIRMKDVGIMSSELEELSLLVSRNKTRTISDLIPLTYVEMKEIYSLMYLEK